jgi:AcrR family transcriptional regulator
MTGRKTALPARRQPPAEVRPYHHGSLRESLLQAAQALLAERGAQGLSLRDVAKAAGVSHAAPYHHFAGLDQLLAAVAQRGFVSLGDAMTAVAGGTDPRENLLAICEAYVAFALHQPAQFRLMFGPLLAHKHEHPDLRDSAERSFGVLMQAAQAYDPAGGALLGLSGWSLAHGLANLAIDGAFDALPIPSAPPQALARLMAERLLPAPAPKAPPPRPRARAKAGGRG